MNPAHFYNEVINTTRNLADAESDSLLIFIKYLRIILESENNEILKMTQMTILFEGFYTSNRDNTKLKVFLLKLRKLRWKQHFGVPTLNFLLSYEDLIEKIHSFFTLPTKMSSLDLTILNIHTKTKVLDEENLIFIEKNVCNTIPMPAEEEIGILTQTYNPSGGFTTSSSDRYTKQFIKYSKYEAKVKSNVLEIGAAFGVTALQAMTKGLTFFCNDVTPRNLAVIKNRLLQKGNNELIKFSGDTENVCFLPGAFPDELIELETDSFDGILISRVLHFLPGIEIQQSLNFLYSILRPGGKLFIVCETPFLKNWSSFLPIYEERVSKEIAWSGEITDVREYEDSGQWSALPKFLNLITTDVLQRVLINEGFQIESLSYINRKDQFPKHMLLDGRESVGAIAVKPLNKKEANEIYT